MNFILLEFIRKVNILLKKKSDVYIVTVIDKKFFKYNKEKIDQQIKEIRLQIESYIKNMQFNIMLTKQYNVILELL